MIRRVKILVDKPRELGDDRDTRVWGDNAGIVSGHPPPGFTGFRLAPVKAGNQS